MCKTGIILLSIGVLLALLVESNGSGCEWSGCKEFAGAPCKTGVTGGSGRHKRYNSRTCGFQGRKDYCCADDCRYVECGVTVIGGTHYTDTVPNERCGVPSQQKFKEFICGGHTGDIYYDTLSGVHRSTDGNGFKSTGENKQGFRDNSGGSGFRSPSGERVGGFRSDNAFRNDETLSNDTNSEVSNGSIRQSNNGGFRNSNSGRFRTK